MNFELILKTESKGRPYVLLSEPGQYEQLALETAKLISSNLSNKILLLRCPIIGEANWKESTERLISVLEEAQIKQASFLSFGEASSITQNLCLTHSKLVRKLVLVNATTRPHSGQVSNVIDWIEQHLPMGLPLRSFSKAFDAKPFLQRIRCPVLLLTTHDASNHVKTETATMEERLPTAWSLKAHSGDESSQIATLVQEFEDVPAKRPQKNLSLHKKATNA